MLPPRHDILLIFGSGLIRLTHNLRVSAVHSASLHSIHPVEPGKSMKSFFVVTDFLRHCSINNKEYKSLEDGFR